MTQPSCRCALLPDVMPGRGHDSVPELNATSRTMSYDADTWTTLYECTVCGSRWEERFSETGHGEIPAMHRLPRQ